MPSNLMVGRLLNVSTPSSNAIITSAYFVSTASVADWIGGGASIGAMIGSALGFGYGMYQVTHENGKGGGGLLAQYAEFHYALWDLFVTTPIATIGGGIIGGFGGSTLGVAGALVASIGKSVGNAKHGGALALGVGTLGLVALGLFAMQNKLPPTPNKEIEANEPEKNKLH